MENLDEVKFEFGIDEFENVLDKLGIKEKGFILAKGYTKEDMKELYSFISKTLYSNMRVLEQRIITLKTDKDMLSKSIHEIASQIGDTTETQKTILTIVNRMSDEIRELELLKDENQELKDKLTKCGDVVKGYRRKKTSTNKKVSKKQNTKKQSMKTRKAKHSCSDVRIMRALKAAGKTLVEIAKDFNTSKTTVNRIINDMSYGGCDGK